MVLIIEDEASRASSGVERDFPRSPFDELLGPLDDLLACFPNPGGLADLDVDQSVKQETASAPVSAYHDPPLPYSPLRPRRSAEETRAVRPGAASRQGSDGSSKRTADLTRTTPTRPFKRLREAFAISPNKVLPRFTGRPTTTYPPSPSKIPLPSSPTTTRHKALPPQPRLPSPIPSLIPYPPRSSPVPPLIPYPPRSSSITTLDSLLTHFNNIHNHLGHTLSTFEKVSCDLVAAQNQAIEDKQRLVAVEEEKKKREDSLLEAWNEVEELRSALKRIRAEKGKAAHESEGMISRLEHRLNEEKTLTSHLRLRITQLENEAEGGDRKVALAEKAAEVAERMARVAREDMEDMRVRLEEAEFAQLALREGGAKLARELAEKERSDMGLRGEARGVSRADLTRGGRI